MSAWLTWSTGQCRNADLSVVGTFFAKYRGPSGGSQLSGGGIIILRIIRRHFLVCGLGPSCQPLHAESTSDGCRLLTTLTTPRRAHPRWWTTARPRIATSRRWEGAEVDSQTERCTRVNWFWCGVVRQSGEKNKRCGGVEGWPGQRWGSASQWSVLSRAASSRRREQVVLAALEEEDERLKMDADHWT